MSETNGNGHAASGGAKFSIVPAQDENISSIAPRLRYSATHDPDLSFGAKVLLHHLTDQSFLSSVSSAIGVVTKSALKLGEDLACSERTIRRFRFELETKRFI